MSGENSNVWTSVRRVSRRGVIRGGVVFGAGLGAALLGCSAGAPPRAAPAGGSATTAGGVATGKPGVPVVNGTPKDGGTWTSAIPSTDVEHDMHSAASASVWHHISERALNPDPWTNEIQANIVEKWEMPDTTHVVMHVRKGVKIHNKPPWNGRDFDADDLAFNINRIMGTTATAEGLPKAYFRRADILAGMDKIEVVDKNIVRMTLAKPSSSFMSGFVDWRMTLMPKGIVEVGFKDPMKFAGMGAFQLSEFVPDAREVFTKAPGYWRQGEPHFDKVVRTVVADGAGQIAGFISKQFDTLNVGSQQDLNTVKGARADANLYATPGILTLYLRPHMDAPMFKDFRVRKALQLSINFQEIGEALYGSDWGVTGPLFPGFPDAWGVDKVKTLPGINPATKAKDIADAVKMMTAAGHDKGSGISFEIQNGPARIPQKENALRFQSQMQKLFPEMKMSVKVIGDAAAWAKVQTSKSFEMITFASNAQGTATLDATTHFHSKGGRNYGNFVNAEADALLDKAAVTLDLKERTAILDTLQTKLQDEWMPMIMLHIETKWDFVQPNVGGFDKVSGPFGIGLPYHRLGGVYRV